MHGKMITGLDHVVVLVNDLDAGIEAYRALLARDVAWRAEGDGAKTALFTLSNATLELMAPSGPQGERVRAALDERGEGLASLCFRVADIEKAHRRLTRVGLNPEAFVDQRGINQLDGADLAWRRTRAPSGATNGARLFFLERKAERPQSAALADSAIAGLDHVVVGTQHPERAAALYGARLGLHLSLDISRPDWGARLMFFRCGDLIVEIAHRLNAEASAEPDKLRGLAWRVKDIAATRARLERAGLDASEVRSGRKPGTQVMTLRSGTCGVPTLLIEHGAA